MFAVTLNTATPQQVVGYAVMSQPTFNKLYTGNPNVIFVTQKDLGGTSAKRFIGSFQKYFLSSSGKLTLNTNA